MASKLPAGFNADYVTRVLSRLQRQNEQNKPSPTQDPNKRLGTIQTGFVPNNASTLVPVIFDGEASAQNLMSTVAVFAGDRVTLDKYGGAWVVRGNLTTPSREKILIKANTTTRANTVTPTDDPELVATIYAAGNYLVTFNIIALASDSFDLRTAWRPDSNVSNGTKYVIGPGTGNDGSDNSTSRWGGAGLATPLNYGARTGNFQFNLVEWSYIQATGAGTIYFQWSQVSSGATVTALVAGSVATVKRIS